MNNLNLSTLGQNEQSLDVIYGPIQPELLREEVLADLLEASARRNPQQVALIFGERQISYGELDRQADQVASALIDAGVRPGDIVGLWLPRGIELLVMQAGIAKGGRCLAALGSGHAGGAPADLPGRRQRSRAGFL